eukprot:Rhum_TRINITY_DN14432_c3_g1::Rhum_TRINITY_DN14432_c3_g1_i1::g.90913::m.90913/K03029/PSMD4, RPN10; 26S proteasome regulatory subunit N10
MTLEATFICIDNSESMRNGDFSPTRLQAVCDACNVLCGAKTQANPENGVGFLTMADDGIRIAETLTQDLGRLLSSITDIRPGGSLDFVKGIQVAHLGLKHRHGSAKNQRQRIVAFVGSKIGAGEKELVSMAKKLKKNSVCVDVVAFGCDDNVELLKKFIETVNSKQQDKDTSNLLVVNEGQSVADALLSSPILNPDGTANAGGDGDLSAFGIDPNTDPELAMVLRMSLEEERARQEKAKQEEGGGDKPADSAAPAEATGEAPAAAAAAAPATQAAGGLSIEEEQMQRAMQMSMQDGAPAETQPGPAAEAPATTTEAMEVDDEDLTEEQMMEMALKMSMEEAADPELDAMMDDANLDAEMQKELGIKKEGGNQ